MVLYLKLLVNAKVIFGKFSYMEILEINRRAVDILLTLYFRVSKKHLNYESLFFNDFHCI